MLPIRLREMERETTMMRLRGSVPTILVVLLLIYSVTCTAASTSATSAGTTFWFSRLDHTLDQLCQGTFTILLVNPNMQQTASIQFVYPYSQTITSLQLPPGQEVIRTLDCWLWDDEQLSLSPSRTRISSVPVYVLHSDIAIQAYVVTKDTRTTDTNQPYRDMSLLLPATALGSTYRLVDDTKPSTGNSQSTTNWYSFAVVAMQNNTELSLRNDANNEQTRTYSLQQGQSLLYHPPFNTSDYDGIRGWQVISNRPVAVFVGSHDPLPADDQPQNDPSSPSPFASRSYAQLVPESVLGTTYLVCPTDTTNNSCDKKDSNSKSDSASCQPVPNVFLYMATQANTTLTLLSGDGGSSDSSFYDTVL